MSSQRSNKNEVFLWGAQASQVGHPCTSDEEVFCMHMNLTGLLITKLGNFSFWVRQKPACCLMKPIKVFMPFRFKTKNVSNAAELLSICKHANLVFDT